MQLALNEQERRALKDLAERSIRSRFDPQQHLPEAPSEQMQENLGAFVTLKQAGHLRGCIGHVIGDRPLWQTIADMAQAAAFDDPRFPSLQEGEIKDLEIEISVLGPLEPVTDPEVVEPGRHGLLVQRSVHSGLLLPQVATEQGWDRETFLGQTCVKAGLPPTAWKSKKTQVYRFEAEVF